MIVLDTHAWIWFVDNPAQLSARARKAIESAVDAGKVMVSSISVWEVCMLVDGGRLSLRVDVAEWIADCERLRFLHFVPVDNEIAQLSVRLPGALHGDPADRMIAATALHLNLPLVTRDQKLRANRHLKTVW